MIPKRKLNNAVLSIVNWAKKYLDCDSNIQFTFEGIEYALNNTYDNENIFMVVRRELIKVAEYQYNFAKADWERIY